MKMPNVKRDNGNMTFYLFALIISLWLYDRLLNFYVHPRVSMLNMLNRLYFSFLLVWWVSEHTKVRDEKVASQCCNWAGINILKLYIRDSGGSAVKDLDYWSEGCQFESQCWHIVTDGPLCFCQWKCCFEDTSSLQMNTENLKIKPLSCILTHLCWISNNLLPWWPG